MGRIKITKAQMARLVENKTDQLIEIAEGKKKASLGSEESPSKPKFNKKGPVRGGSNPEGKKGKPTIKPVIAPTKTTTPPQTSTPEAWRVDAGGCLQCPSPNPNCPFPTEQDCLNSLDPNNGNSSGMCCDCTNNTCYGPSPCPELTHIKFTSGPCDGMDCSNVCSGWNSGPTQQSYKIDAGGCLPCPSTATATQCPYIDPNCTITSTGNVVAQCCNDPQGNQVAPDCSNCFAPNICGNCTPVIEEYFSARSVGILNEDEYDEEYGEIDDFEDFEDNVKYDYYPDSETPIDALEEAIRRRLNEIDECECKDGGRSCCNDSHCPEEQGNDSICGANNCCGGWPWESPGGQSVINTNGNTKKTYKQSKRKLREMAEPCDEHLDGNGQPSQAWEDCMDNLPEPNPDRVSTGGGNTKKTYKQSKRKNKAAGVNRELTSESIRRHLNQYGTRDERQGRRLDEQWSGIVGEPCCPVHPKPNTPNWFAMNHYDNQGNPCIGGCGDHREPMGIDMAEEHRKDHEGNRVKKKNYKGQRNNHDDKSGGLVHYQPHPHWCCEWGLIVGCFAKGDEVEMSDGTMKAIELIKIGDVVKSGRNNQVGIVSETLVHPVNDVVQVVNINGITAEPYHPVLVDNKWIPIKELGNISNKFIGNWYNLKIESNTDTNFIIGDVVVSGLGNDCQRLLKDSDKRENQTILV